MLTYQVRPRIYRLEEGKKFSFPNNVELIFHIQPLQSFGKEPGGGRTAVRAVEAKSLFDANTGRHWIQSKNPLQPLEVIIDEPIRRIEMRGNELHIYTRFNSLKEMDETVQSLFFAFPILLNIEFADPPFVERIAGKVGKVDFRWELDSWRMNFDITTQELQEKRIALSWERLGILSKPENRRIIAALHYFHVACRLSRAGNAPWEFMSEVIINLSKVLEVLFPPRKSDGKTLDSARSGLADLKYKSKEIECNFVPAVALRNNIDSAHVDLSIFTREQLRVLHAYTEIAETAFRELLKRVLRGIETKRYTPVQYGEPSRRRVAEKIIDRIAQHCVSLDDMSKPYKQ
ncbi:MAG: hypothetical protein ACYSUY_02115 [Planctomycetota bacterium]